MRFIAYSNAGTPTMGVAVDDRVVPLCEVAEFYADLPSYRAAAATKTAAAADGLALTDVEPAIPVPATAHVLCAGLNYRDHAAEATADLPTVPDVFGRWASTLNRDGGEVPLPPREHGLDWEGELAAVVGAPLRDVDEAEAEEAILGYVCFNDLSARGFQFAGKQVTVGKNADGSAPIGAQIVEPDDLGRARDLRIRTTVNGRPKQEGSTAQLVFTAAQIIAYVSGCMSLRPGDLVATGTPAGVGFSRAPAELLGSGDVVTVSIEGIGELTNTIA
ncbi:MAG: fumarylacetoacetate hydrolase [Streptosporangiales bacterium]|nr:fumarylacetoacetate hydrolase [Streptosporangiales bacterium]